MSHPDGEGQRRLNPLVLALLGGLASLLLLLWFFSSNRNPDQDKLSNPQVEQTAANDDPGKRCSTNATYDLVKRELFRLAAQNRGEDLEALGAIGGAAVLRVENAVLEGEDQSSRVLNCSGSFNLDLPPGVVTSDGRHGLSAELDYAIQPGGNIELRNAEPIIGPLASITRLAAPVAVIPNGIAAAAVNGSAAVVANVEAGPAAAASAPARPSFNCASAETSGELAVCGDSNLAALDVKMSVQYRRALVGAGPVQKDLLQSTRDRFLDFRDRCSSRQCIADAYAGRMREIRDIMDGRLVPAR